MKRVLSIVLVALMLLSLLALGGCGKNEALKFGMAVSGAYGTSAPADGETNGTTEVIATAAAVLLDKDNKIVQCVIDEVALKATYTAEGKAVANSDLRSKGEKGTDYGMAAYGTYDVNNDGVIKEWDEQIAAFIETIKGKTIDEVKAMVVEGYGNEDIQKAGCTITVDGFVTALEKAVAKAIASQEAEEGAKVGVTDAESVLRLGVSASEEATDATEEKAGTNEINATFTAAAVDKDGKVLMAATDALQAKVSYDTKGVVTSDVKAALTSKADLGEKYGMAAYGTYDVNGDGVIKEWDEQGKAFDAALTGKTAEEIAALEKDGYGIDSLQTAGCTIAISDMVKAAVKAATVK